MGGGVAAHRPAVCFHLLAWPAAHRLQVFQSIPTCIDLLEGPYIETHPQVVKAFRPGTMERKERPAAQR